MAMSLFKKVKSAVAGKKKSPSKEIAICKNMGIAALEGEGIASNLPSAPEFIRTEIKYEASFLIEISREMDTKHLKELLLPLFDLENKYRGPTKLKEMWLTLIAVFGLMVTRQSITQQGVVYRFQEAKGLKLIFEGDEFFAPGPELSYSQSFRFVSNGIHSEWRVVMSLTQTNQPGYPLKISEKIEEYLKEVGRSSYMQKDGSLIIRN